MYRFISAVIYIFVLFFYNLAQQHSLIANKELNFMLILKIRAIYLFYKVGISFIF